jgi:signal transduction histidine kinase
LRGHAAYRAATRLPTDSLWLRVVLVTGLSALLGFYGVQAHALPAESVAFLLWSAALLTPLVDAWRALLYEYAARRSLSQLLWNRLSPRTPSPSPIVMQNSYLLDTYQSRLLLHSLGLLGAALLLAAAVIRISLPALRSFAGSPVELQPLLFWAPAFGITWLTLGIIALRQWTRPLDRWIAENRSSADPLTYDPVSSPLLGPALRIAEQLPAWVAWGKLGLLFFVELLLGAAAVYLWRVPPRFAGFLLGETSLCLLAAAYFEWPWHAALLSPFVQRQRPPRAVSTQPLLVLAFALPLLLFSGLLGELLWELHGPLGRSALLRPAVLSIGVLFFTALTLLWRWSGQLLRPLRALTAGAAALARFTPAEVSPAAEAGKDGSSEVLSLRQALVAMHEVLSERLLSTTQAQTQLEADVTERTVELRRRNQELEQALQLLGEAQEALLHAEKMASIGRLVAGIAHEINNPINAVINTAYPLREALQDIADKLAAKPTPGSPPVAIFDAEPPSSAPPLLAMMRVVGRGARRAQEIVQALSNYSEGGGDPPIRVDIHRVLDEAWELLQHPFKPLVQVVRSYSARREVTSLGGQLGQVFINLFSNAIHALKLRAESEPALRAQLLLTTHEDEDAGELHIAVRDNGLGIPQEVLPRIFDPFFTTKDATEGSGLGLSIVHGIVARHHGQIRVETAIGQGSCFTVILPFSDG